MNKFVTLYAIPIFAVGIMLCAVLLLLLSAMATAEYVAQENVIAEDACQDMCVNQNYYFEPMQSGMMTASNSVCRCIPIGGQK